MESAGEGDSGPGPENGAGERGVEVGGESGEVCEGDGLGSM